jgi:putative transposase
MDPIELIQQGKIKRYFRATRKLTAPNLVSHITQRAAGKEPLFIEDGDYLFMIYLLKEITQSYSLKIYSFCLMPNHLHLLASPTEDNLSDAMRDLFSRYAMKFNKKYERKGHLFGGPYRQAVCMDDTYLLTASLYIHLNPVKAGITEDPFKYRWSSCGLFCEPAVSKAFVKPDFILRLLAGRGKNEKEIYSEMLKRGTQLKQGNVMEKEDSIEHFRKKLATLFPDLFRSASKKKEIAKVAGIEILSWEELEELLEDLRTGGRNGKPTDREAKKYLIEQLIARGYKKAEIAEKLEVSIKTIYNILKSTQ